MIDPINPTPGIYEGVPFDQYRRIRALNASSMKWGRVSMKHLHAAVNGEITGTDSEAKKFGRAVHLRILEPERYKRDIIIQGRCCAATRSGNQCTSTGRYWLDGDWFCGTHRAPDATEQPDAITREQADLAEQIAYQVNWPQCDGRTELTLIAEWGGVLCKARLDWIDRECILDLKTCEAGAVGNDDCERSIVAYDWHIQAFWYRSMWEQLTGESLPFRWLFVEKSAPFDSNLIEADDESLQIAEIEVRRTLDQWRECVRAGRFPGVAEGRDEVFKGGLTDWYRSKFRESPESVEVTYA